MRLRAALLATTVLAATVAGSVAPLAPVAAADPNAAALTDPFGNVAPSFGFQSACTRMDGTRSRLDACMSAAVPDFDQARQDEGLSPLVLPNDFDSLSAPEQLLALTDIERVDRGLAPVPALSSRLNTLAQAGAESASQPQFPSPADGSGGGSNWFPGGSTLLAVFTWMYDSGPTTDDPSCTATGQPGCWAGRHTILGTGAENGDTLGYDTPIAMGAGVSRGSLTELIVGGDSTDQPDRTPTWDQIVATSTFGVDKTNISLEIEPGQQGSATVTATSSNITDTLRAEISDGADQWSVSPASCPITPGASCRFVVTFAPPDAGRFPGLLDISSGLTLRTVGLAGVGSAPQVVMNPDRAALRFGQTLTIFGAALDSATGDGVAGVAVSLQTRLNGGSPWRTLSTLTSDGSGNATFRLRPRESAAYRLAILDTTGKVVAATPSRRVRVY